MTKETRKESTTKRTRASAADSSRTNVASVLVGAEKRLRRFARRRQTNEAKAAYREAAQLVHKLAREQ